MSHRMGYVRYLKEVGPRFSTCITKQPGMFKLTRKSCHNLKYNHSKERS